MAVARGSSICGDILAETALVLTLQGSGHGGIAVAGVLLAQALPLVLLAPLTGRLVDRVDSRTLLVTAGLSQAVLCAVLAYTSHPLGTIGLLLLLSCGLAVSSPTFAALLPETVSREDLPRASALSQTASSVGLLIGPALAGVLVGQYGARSALLLDAASYLAIVLAGLLIRTRRGRRPAGEESGSGRGALLPRWQLRRDPLLGPVVVALGVIVAALTAVNVVEVFFVRETMGASATWYGMVSATWTGGMLVGAWLAARRVRRILDDGALGVGVLLLLGGSSAAVLFSAAIPSVGWLIPIWLIGGVTNGGTNTFLAVLVAQRVPATLRGRAYAQLGGVGQGGSVAGYILGGVMLAWLAPRTLVAAAGVASLLMMAASAGPVVKAARRDDAGIKGGSGRRVRDRVAVRRRPVEPASRTASR